MEKLTTVEEYEAMTPEEVKIFEARLRRAAKRQGLYLQKVRRRDPRARDYGTYYLLDERGNPAVHDGQGGGIYLLNIEQALFGEEVAA